jgi:hypothetical protein
VVPVPGSVFGTPRHNITDRSPASGSDAAFIGRLGRGRHGSGSAFTARADCARPRRRHVEALCAQCGLAMTLEQHVESLRAGPAPEPPPRTSGGVGRIIPMVSGSPPSAALRVPVMHDVGDVLRRLGRTPDPPVAPTVDRRARTRQHDGRAEGRDEGPPVRHTAVVA